MTFPPIAIIGIGCRFPGGAHGPDAFWKILRDGVDAITDVPADRWNTEAHYDSTPGRKGKTIARWGGFLDAIDQFDAGFFGVSPREAAFMDPQQRLLLHAAWEALDDGGEPFDAGRGTPVGVFVGICTNDYSLLQCMPNDLSTISPYTATGGAASIAANRISYCLNLLGPSVAVDTACSSSLVAVHLACTSLWNGECPLALAGGVNVIIGVMPFVSFSRSAMLSPDGRCKAFDARANGFVRGEGVGVVALKPLAAALADGNSIYAVIRGTGVNQDGRTSGISVPSASAQAALVRETCRNAGILPSQVHYVEAHGTGTAVGDPIEAQALGTALGAERNGQGPCVIGSVKTNIGHLEGAAGIAGLIKTALLLKHGQIPPSLHFKNPNPHIDFEKLNLRVAQALESCPNGGEPLIASVNSFGFGGTNAHAVLQALSNGQHQRHPARKQRPAARACLLPISARSDESLRGIVQKYQVFLSPGGEGHSLNLDDICFTASACRTQHPNRLCVASTSREDLIEHLGAFLAGESRAGSSAGQPMAEPAPVFVCSGQGPQWWAMGRELLKDEPLFRQKIEECDHLFRELGGWSLMDELARDESSSRLEETAIAQPAIFALQVALAALWQAWGIRPGAVVGHSVGEVAAAHLAGVLSLPEAARVVFHRGRCMDAVPANGRMLAAALSWQQAGEAIAGVSDRVSVAALNGPDSVTLSGDAAALEAIAAALKQRSIFCRFLRVNYAFHSQQMELVRDELLRALGRVEAQPASLCLISTVTGAAATAADYDADYWWRNVRLPVRFATAIDAFIERGRRLFLELSPHPVLGGSILECLKHRSVSGTVLASLRRNENERATMLGALGALHVLGCPVNWRGVYPAATTVRLPAYAWSLERYWHETEQCRMARLSPVAHPLLKRRLPAAEPAWETAIDTESLPYLQDHQVQGRPVFPAAGYVEMALGAARALFGTGPSVIEDVDFQKAFFLPAGEETSRTQFSYRPQDASFTISSSAGGPEPSWTIHAVGRVRAGADGAPPAACAIKRLQQTCRQEIAVAASYQRFCEMGLPYGPAFRGVEAAWRTDGEALGRVRLPAQLEAESGKYQLHPALLDACFQVLLLAMPAHEASERRMLFLPVQMERLRLFARPGSVVWSHARLVRNGDRMVVGDIRLLDDDGRVLVEITGFRCQAVGQARPGATDDLNEWLYEPRWKLTPGGRTARASDYLPPVSAIVARLRPLARELGRACPREMRAELDQLSLLYILAAFKQLGWHLRRGQMVTFDGLASRLGVAARHRRVFERFLRLLERDGVLRRSAAGWKIQRTVPAADAEAVGRQILARFPRTLPELTLIRRCGRELAAVLRGQTDPLPLIFPEGSAAGIEHFYQDSDSFRNSNRLAAEAVAAALAKLPEGRTVRVLEIGAGTGGMTAHVLPQLPKDRAEYVFSDLSNLFFNRAEQKFFDYPFVRYQLLDIEKPPQEQGFEPHTFDLVLASDALHATKNLRQTLSHIRTLLAPRGLLMLSEVDRPPVMADLVFGLTEGWWRFNDTDLRQAYPLLEQAGWLALFREMGFAEADAISDKADDEPFQPRQSIFLVREPKARNDEAAARVSAVPRSATPGTWVLFADRNGLAQQVATRLAARGDRPVTVVAGRSYRRLSPAEFEVCPETPADLRQLLAEIRSAGLPAIAGVIHLWNLDAPPPAQLTAPGLRAAEAAGCHSILHLAQALTQDSAGELPRLWLITRGAQAVERADPVAVAQAPLWGLGRVLLKELPKFRSRLVDLTPAGDDHEAEMLVQELDAADGEDEIAFRGTARYAGRLVKTALEQHVRPRKIPRNQAGCRLEISSPGALDRLIVRSCQRRAPGPGEVEIEVKAAALNFRDVMKVLGIYPTEDDRDTLLGDECAGQIIAVGRGVKHLRPGDEVVAIGPGAFRSHLTIPAAMVARKPARLGFDEAATMPIAFLTAWYALHHLGRIRRGERVLIQAATGGVGLAAVQLAQQAGAEIFATAGNPEKRDFLRAQGVRHVMDSRSLAFAEEVRALTNGRGVDLVLNSLSGEAITKGLATLAPHGRFLEIGKRDVYQNTKLGLRPFRHNISLFVIDLAQMMQNDPALVGSLLKRTMTEAEAGRWHPLPLRIFQLSQAVNAFRHMSQARHIGKIIVAMDSKPMTPVPARGTKPMRFKANASYLITGGLGGFGLAVAEWMLQNGARHFILVGRSGAATGEAQQALDALRKSGAKVVVAKADVANPRDVARVFRTVARRLPPLRGIVHAAMVLDDGAITQLSGERFRQVMAPKADGAWNLHAQSDGLPLDFFVLFSSFSSVVGNPGQGSYAAANGFLEAMAHHRRARGLPALVVNWGLLNEVGYVARNARVKELMRQHGVIGLRPAEATAILGRLLQSSATQMCVFKLDWRKWSGAFPTDAVPPRFSEIIHPSAMESPGDDRVPRESIVALPAGERLPALTTQLKDQVAKVLRTSAAKLDTQRPLNELGLDSLMSIELLERMEGHFGVALPQGHLTAGASIAQIAGDMLGLLTGAAAGPLVEATAPATPGMPANSLVALRRDGEGLPLFCIHPAGGLVILYEHLVKRLPPDRPIYGIQSRVLSTGASEHDSIASLAVEYAGLIMAQQPQGPYFLLGFSLGGLFAMAAAHALEAGGQPVAFVGLIDSDLRLTDPAFIQTTFLKPFMVTMYSTFAREVPVLKPLDAGELEKVTSRLATQLHGAPGEAWVSTITLWLMDHDYILPQLSAGMVTKYLKLFFRHSELVQHFKPAIIRSPLAVWSVGGPASVTADWRNSTSAAVMENIIPGTHYDLMYPPRVDTLAGQLTAALNKVQGS
jgi:acyl transferase domain-containing protein/thioesterase domain-containing protein/acyl carrier protein